MSHSLFPVPQVSVAVTLEEVGSPSPEQHLHPIFTLCTHSPGLNFKLLLWLLQHQLLRQQLQRCANDFIA